MEPRVALKERQRAVNTKGSKAGTHIPNPAKRLKKKAQTKAQERRSRVKAKRARAHVGHAGTQIINKGTAPSINPSGTIENGHMKWFPTINLKKKMISQKMFQRKNRKRVKT